MSFDLPEVPLTEPWLLFTVLMAAILLSPIVARRLRLPDVVTMVVIGFLIGPTGLGVIERVGVVEVLGYAGLLYLMFVAGLELDLDDFVEHRGDSLGFGGLTFLFPMGLGTAAALALGYSTLAALLIGSCWASHTLVTYPVFQRLGTVRNRAVATAVGATIVTDTAALMVLAVVARAHQGALTPVFWITLLPSLALLIFATVSGLPRLARWFFAHSGQDRSLRFLFVMLALFLVSSLAHVVGIEAIVGAFLAGLALNRSVPNGGALMERIDFLGATLFVPLFLLSTGMLIDLQVLGDPRTLVIGGVFTAVALVSKLLAAWVTGRYLGYQRAEIGAMFSLSAAQAAATLAAIVVGLSIGLLDATTVNAVMLVILVTCLVSPATAARYAPRLPRPVRDRSLGEVVVVPIANPATAPRLIRLASQFAHADGGLVVPVMVVPSETDRERLAEARALVPPVLRVAQSAGAEARTVLRIDATPDTGITHTLVEHEASLLVMGWQGHGPHAAAPRLGGPADTLFGGIVDKVLSRSSVPTLLLSEGEQRARRVLLVLDETLTNPAGAPAVDLAIATARLVARSFNLEVQVVTNLAERWIDDRVMKRLGVPVEHDPRRRAIVVRDRARPTDLVVVPTLGDEPSLAHVAARILRAVPEDASLLVVLDNAVVPAAAAPMTTTGDASEPASPVTSPADTATDSSTG